MIGNKMSPSVLNEFGASCLLNDRGDLLDGVLVRMAFDVVVDLNREAFETTIASLAGFPALREVSYDVEGLDGGEVILRVRGNVRQNESAHGGFFLSPETVRLEFERREFWFDEAESNDETAGFSRFEQTDDPERVYWFGCVSASGIHVYASHPCLDSVPRGLWMGCESDGTGYLARDVPDASDSLALSAAIECLEEAVASVVGKARTLRLL
jgi:hypothetical protein